MVLVTIKWNKQSFEKVPLDPAQGVDIFKSQIYSLTGLPPPLCFTGNHDSASASPSLHAGVPIERQKLMAKGAWVGTLKDDADLEKMNIKENQQILLMGTAEVIAAPTAQVSFPHLPASLTTSPPLRFNLWKI
jgi:ubiquitin carboxyl-terminal hydrolase 14